MPALTHLLPAKRTILPLLASLWAGALPAATGIQFGDAPEPLPVEEAFVPEVTAKGRDQLEISFAIAEGYYLYRDKLSFSITAAESQVGEPGASRAANRTGRVFRRDGHLSQQCCACTAAGHPERHRIGSPDTWLSGLR